MFKKIAIIFVSFLTLIYILFLVSPFIITPIVNNYTGVISDEIKKASGLDSKIEGIKFVTTPKLTAGVKINKFILLDKEKELLSADNFQAKMSLLPLLAGRLEADLVKVEKLNLNIDLNNLPAAEPATQAAPSEPVKLPFKLSNHLPDIKIGNYDIKLNNLQIKGSRVELTDFILNKGIKVLADGSVLINNREQFKYNIKLNNKIMPEIDLNELVFNPAPKEDKKNEEIQIDPLEIINGIYNYKITGNLDTVLTTTRKGFDGYINLDNLSIISLPESNMKLKFSGKKMDINTNLYTAQNEVSTLIGTVKDKKIDLNFKSKAQISNLIKILNAIALTFDIKDLQTLSANGNIDADFNIKSNLKTVNSNGYFKIPSANIYYGLYKIGIDNINADVALNNNNINIKNIGFSILNQPLKIFGTISEKAVADVHVNAENLSLRDLAIACGQGALLKDIDLSGGVTLKSNILGKLDKLNITADVLSNVKVDKINFNVAGKIKNDLSLDFVTTGDIKSTLTGNINAQKQTLNLNFKANDSEIIVPMFDKSKMRFNGNVLITGNMMAPVLSGVINVPSLNIPEIPVTMTNLVANLNGKASVQKFTSGGIVGENITSDYAIKGENFYLNNLQGSAFDGKFSGNIIYNLNNAKTLIDFKGEGMNAEKAVYGATGVKNALSGTLGFNTNLSLLVLDYNDMMKSLKGNLDFKITNGAFGSIGRLENFFGAGNISTNVILKSTVSTLSNLAGIKNTAKFDYISGNMTFSNGWADLKSIKSTGATLAYFVNGKYNLINGTTNVVVLGRLDSAVVKLLGPVGDLSADKLLSAIPKFGPMTAKFVEIMTTDPRGENIAAIPALTGGSGSHKDFKVVFNGGLESTSSIKSFKWLTKVDTSAIEQKSVSETIKSLKGAVNTDVKDVIDKVTTQKELIKNSAAEIKNLFKF